MDGSNVTSMVPFSLNRELGYGWIVRNVKGQMIIAYGSSFKGPMDASLAEVVSVRDVVS